MQSHSYQYVVKSWSTSSYYGAFITVSNNDIIINTGLNWQGFNFLWNLSLSPLLKIFYMQWITSYKQMLHF